jgi:acetyl-CoA acetyltransferase
MAEIFNAVVLSLKRFVALHKQKKVFYYPEHKKYLKRMKKYWLESEDIDKWIVKSFDYLKKAKKNNLFEKK